MHFGERSHLLIQLTYRQFVMNLFMMPQNEQQQQKKRLYSSVYLGF